MAKTTKQRRNKTTTDTTSPPVSCADDSTDDKITEAGATNKQGTSLSLEEQLDRAEAAVYKARDATAYLHGQWRTHLFRISFLVLILSFHQCQKPMKECMANIKLANQQVVAMDNVDEQLISGYEAFWIITGDAFCEICGNCMLFCLSAFLAMKPAGTFSSPLYLIATLLLPLQLTSYFAMREQIGCPHVLVLEEGRRQQEEQLLQQDAVKDDDDIQLRDFPVTLVFHAIVTACYFFMESQMAGREQDIRAVLKLRNDLANARSSNNNKGQQAKKVSRTSASGGGDKKRE